MKKTILTFLCITLGFVCNASSPVIFKVISLNAELSMDGEIHNQKNLPIKYGVITLYDYEVVFSNGVEGEGSVILNYNLGTSYVERMEESYTIIGVPIEYNMMEKTIAMETGLPLPVKIRWTIPKTGNETIEVTWNRNGEYFMKEEYICKRM